ncbi:MAG: efflux RND transporter periplasmic adaptor subunit [Janthinobacterium lividum]
MTNNINKKQWLAVLLVVLAGVLLAAALIGGGSGKHEDEASHDRHAEEAHASTEAGPVPASEHGAAGGHNQQGGHTKVEEKIAMQDSRIQAAGITIARAKAGQINTALTVPGQIRYNEDRTAHVVPRLAGVVESVVASLGQQVKRGQVLAVITSAALSEQRSELLTAKKRLELARLTAEREKKLWLGKISAEQDYLQAQQAMQEAQIVVRNLQQKLAAIGAAADDAKSLSRFEIRAPFDGMVMEKHISLGEAVKEDASIFTISDLSRVWAEIDVAAKDIEQVRVGEEVLVKSVASNAGAQGTISYVGALLGEQTRTAKAHIVLANPNGAWRPGLAVSAEIITARVNAEVSVVAEAIQTVDDKPVVFLRLPGGFRAQEVVVGATDGKTTAVTKGLKPGDEYAATGSFTLKSEQGKSSVEHAH